MANQSIKSAFERFWQHVIAKIEESRGENIDYGSSLPSTGEEGDVFLLTDSVNISIASMSTDISNIVLKANDNGNCITVLVDYNLAADSGEEQWSFSVPNGENKTFLAAYALTGNGLVSLDDGMGYNSTTHFGQSLNDYSPYFVQGIPKFSGQQAALVVYYV